MTSVIRGSFYTLSAQVLGAASTASVGILVARRLGADGFGRYAFALAATMLLAPLVDFGVSLAGSRTLAGLPPGATNARREVYVTALLLKVPLVAGAASIGYVCAHGIAAAYGHPEFAGVLRASALGLVGQSFLTLVWSTLIVERRGRLNFLVVSLRVVVEVVLTVAALAAGYGAAGATYARGVAHCVAAAAGLTVILWGVRGSTITFESARLRQFLRVSSGLAFVEASYGALYQVDVLMVAAFMSSRAVGLYQAPLRLLTPITYTGIALAAGVAPAVAQERSLCQQQRLVRNAVRLVAAGETVISLAAFAAAPWLTKLVFGSTYAESAHVLRLLTPYVFVAAFAPVASLLVTYGGSLRGRMVVGASALALNVLLDVLFIPHFGLTGAAVSADGAALYYIGSHFWLLMRQLELRASALLVPVGVAATGVGGLAVLMSTVGAGPFFWIGVATCCGCGLTVYFRWMISRDRPAVQRLPS